MGMQGTVYLGQMPALHYVASARSLIVFLCRPRPDEPFSVVSPVQEEEDVLQAVDRFVVGRKGVGEVAFIGSVDVRGLHLDRIIDIEKGRIQVYGLPGGAQRPAVGQELNQPALLTFR